MRLARTQLFFTSDDIFQAIYPSDKWPDEVRMLALTRVMVRAQFYGTVVRVHDRGWRSCIFTGRLPDRDAKAI